MHYIEENRDKIVEIHLENFLYWKGLQKKNPNKLIISSQPSIIISQWHDFRNLG